MKTRFYSILCAALVLGTVSCSKEVSPVVEEKPAVVSLTAGFDDVKTTVANDGKVAWAEGDQLWVKCGSETAVFTLDPADAGKNVGRFTTTSVMDFQVGSSLEAYYPAEVGNNGSPVWPAEQTYAENMGCPMHATATIATEGTAPQLSFKNLGSILRLSIGTSQAGKKVKSIIVSSTTPLAGAFSVDADGKAIISGTQTDITLDCGEEGIEIGTTPKTINVAIPANATSTTVYEDFAVAVNSTDDTFAESLAKDLTKSLERNKVYDNNTFAAAAFAPFPENCYIVAPGTTDFVINTLHIGHSIKPSKALSAAKGVKVVWESVNTAEAPSVNSIITNVAYNAGFVTFSTGIKGNACIAVTDGEDGSGNILCGWHIWVVDPADVANVTCTDGETVFMGRALGATTDEGNGLGYQRGRKDPVVGCYGYDSASRMTASNNWFTECVQISTEMYRNDIYGVNSLLDYSLSIPGRHFVDLTTTIAIYDWYQNTNITAAYPLWKGTDSRYSSDGKKSMFDPCPSGYKVPSPDELEVFFAGPISFSAPEVTLANGEKYYLKKCAIGRLDRFISDEVTAKINGFWTCDCEPELGAPNGMVGNVVGLTYDGKYNGVYRYRGMTCLEIRCVQIK